MIGLLSECVCVNYSLSAIPHEQEYFRSCYMGYVILWMLGSTREFSIWLIVPLIISVIGLVFIGIYFDKWIAIIKEEKKLR